MKIKLENKIKGRRRGDENKNKREILRGEGGKKEEI